jgi:hypothetical protein
MKLVDPDVGPDQAAHAFQHLQHTRTAM